MSTHIQDIIETVREAQDRFKYYGKYRTENEIGKLLEELAPLENAIDDFMEERHTDGYSEGQEFCRDTRDKAEDILNDALDSDDIEDIKASIRLAKRKLEDI